MKLSQEEFDNLSTLMLSTDDANTQIALEILASQELDDEIKRLLTEIFVVYKMSNNADAQKQASDILERFGSAALKTRMNRKFDLGDGSAVESTIATNIVKYTSGTELDPLKFAKALYNKSGTGIVFLLEKLQGDDVRNFLKKFISGTRFSLLNKQITSLPKEFYEFSFLTEIDLSGNALGTVYKEFKVFTELRVLNMRNNKVKSLPKDFAKLTKLEYLDLADNNFADFPAVLVQLPHLRELNIKQFAGWNNRAELMHESFFGVKTLKKLTLGEPDQYNPGDYQCHQMSNYPLFYSIEATNADEYLDLSPLAAAKKAFKDHRQAVGYLFKHGDSETINEVIKAFYDEKTKTLDLNHHCIINIPKELLQWDIRAFSLEGARIGYNGGWCASDVAQLFEGIARYMPNLEKLDLNHNAFSNRTNVTPLLQLKNLKEICWTYLKSEHYSHIADKIRQALPDCKIY